MHATDGFQLSAVQGLERCEPTATTSAGAAASRHRGRRRGRPSVMADLHECKGLPPRKPLLDCTALLSQPERLRAQARETGYLYLPGILPSSEVDALRSDLLGVAAAPEHAWLAPNTEHDDGVVREGVFEGEDIATPEYIAYYNDAQSIRRLHSLPHHPALLAVLQTLFGEEPFVHPRHIAHVLFPLDTEMLRQRDSGELQGKQDHLTTCPHQDFWPVRGSAETWTAWVPLGECGQSLGGIEIAAGSHHLGEVSTKYSLSFVL